MAKALTIQSLSVAGTSITFVSPNGAGAGAGNTFLNDDRTMIVVVNADTSTHTITVPSNNFKVDGVAVPDHTQLITTSPSVNFVWVPAMWFATGGVSAIDFDSTTSLTVAAVQMPAAFQ